MSEAVDRALVEIMERRKRAQADELTSLKAEVKRLTEENGKLRRCLLPVWMGMAEAELGGEPIPDSGVVLHFMGSGASDQVTAGEIRAALSTQEAKHDG